MNGHAFARGAPWLAGLVLATTAALSAQQLLERVVARVDGSPVFLSDVRAAAGFGLIDAAGESAQTQQLVRRQVLLGEVSRFPPPDPDAGEIAAEVARMKARVKDAAAFQRDQGLSELQVQGLARDTLRIDAYLSQRFGAARPKDAVEQWMRDLEARADVVIPRSP
jgi:hypothetical protein